jgi:hypothetical protein
VSDWCFCTVADEGESVEFCAGVTQEMEYTAESFFILTSNLNFATGGCSIFDALP